MKGGSPPPCPELSLSRPAVPSGLAGADPALRNPGQVAGRSLWPLSCLDLALLGGGRDPPRDADGEGGTPPSALQLLKRSAVRPVPRVAKEGGGGRDAAGPRAVGVESRDRPLSHSAP